MLAFAKAVPSLFDSFYEDFFISSSDSYQIRTVKLEILSTIATESSVPFIFEEFQVKLLLLFKFIISTEVKSI